MAQRKLFLAVTYNDRTEEFVEGDFYAGCPGCTILMRFNIPRDRRFELRPNDGDEADIVPNGMHDCGHPPQGKYKLVLLENDGHTPAGAEVKGEP